MIVYAVVNRGFVRPSRNKAAQSNKHVAEPLLILEIRHAKRSHFQKMRRELKGMS